MEGGILKLFKDYALAGIAVILALALCTACALLEPTPAEIRGGLSGGEHAE